MKGCSTSTIFWLLIGVFAIVLAEFFIPAFRNLFKSSLLFLLPIAVFFLLGLALILSTLKQRITGKLKKFLLLTGASASGFFVSILLHNFIYALSTVTGHIIVLNYLVEALHMTFFFIAIIVCPIGFLVGIIGSALLLIKNKKVGKIN